MDIQRSQRKLDHIRYALSLGDGPAHTRLADIRFLHNCLPELNPADITLSKIFFGKKLSYPLMIDAATGGADAVTELNRQLATVAKTLNIGMAVGSQYGAVKNHEAVSSYKAAREENPTGLILGNISTLASPKEALEAVSMLSADGLQLHLNVAQEAFMSEGDKNSQGDLERMLAIAQQLEVPVIVKETGCGIAKEQYALLQSQGFKYFDCAGSGGTNFPAIEAARSGRKLSSGFASWGQPTCWSLIDAGQVLSRDAVLFASGGIRTGEDVAKAFALGADMVCITAPVLSLVKEHGVTAAVDYLTQVLEELKLYMALLGCKTVEDLRKMPLVILGETKDYIACRGYDLVKLCVSRR